MSIFDRDFSKIVPSAFMNGSLAQAVNVLESALKEIELLKKENDNLLTTWADMKDRRDAFGRENECLRTQIGYYSVLAQRGLKEDSYQSCRVCGERGHAWQRCPENM